jgi:hypothetical protein
MDLARFVPYFIRGRRTAVGVLAIDGDGQVDIGSGVLVRLGGA